MEYYAVIQKSDDPYTITWNDFQEIFLSDKSTMQDNIYSMPSFIKNKRGNKER